MTYIGQIPDQGSCPLSSQLTEDRHRHASGPVQPSVPLHKVPSGFYLFGLPALPQTNMNKKTITEGNIFTN